MAESRLVHKDLLLHPGYCTLKLFARDLYWRIWLHADDYGRYHAATNLLRPFLYPTELDKTRESDIERALLDLESASLVRLYNEAGARYLEIPAALYRQRLRTKSKFPAPPQSAATCRNLPQSAATCRNLPQSAAPYGDVYGDEIEKEERGGNIAPPTIEQPAANPAPPPPQKNDYLAWVTAVKNAHPAGRELRSFHGNPKLREAARAAYAALPQAVDSADLLAAYYTSTLTTSTNGRPFKRPLELLWYFTDLADILVSARQWARETRWKPAGQPQPRQTTPPPPTPDPDQIITEADKTAFFAELHTTP